MAAASKDSATKTLSEFLLARIGEDEAQARDAIAKRDAIAYTHPPVVPDMALMAFEDVGVPAVLVGPERVLAECEAKRQVVELHAENDSNPSRFELQCWNDGEEYPCQTLRILALPYADHPAYRREWRP